MPLVLSLCGSEPSGAGQAQAGARLLPSPVASLCSGFNRWFACRIAHWGRKCHGISGAAADAQEVPSTCKTQFQLCLAPASHNSSWVWLVTAW